MAIPQKILLSLKSMKDGQASRENLFPLGYGERERIKVMVKRGLNM